MLFGFLMLPFFHQARNIEAASLGFGDHCPGFPDHGSIDHLAVQSPGTSPGSRSLLIGNDNADSPFDFCLVGAEHALDDLYLAGVDAL